MNNGPRIYNALSDEERIARLQRKASRKVKEVHRVRRNRIIVGFAIVFIILGIQLIRVHIQTANIKAQAAASQAQLTKLKKDNKALKNQVIDLRDSDYLAKMIRYKYYYSKPGETIYDIPEPSGDNK